MIGVVHLARVFPIFLLSAARAATVDRDIIVVNEVIAPDGFSRSTVLAGGTFPGTLIQGFKGDRFLLNVTDALTDNTMEMSTSIHWHGISQHGSNWADGVSMITQCPITPNNSFLYDFTVPDQAGTYWYHSHLSTQYCDGLRGPFVIYDQEDPHASLFDVDDATTIITLADWYHSPALTALPPMTLPPVSVSTLINGKGRYPGGPTSPLSVINVVHLKRYRLRIIGMSCDPNFIFSIDGHNLTIIEADGVNTQPLTVDSLQVFAGQRYSVVLTADQPVANYWIRANPNYSRGTQGFDGGINSAILRYQGAPAVDPTTTNTTSVIPFVETNLHPLVNPAAPGPPQHGDADVVLNIAHFFDTSVYQYKVNGVTFVPPTVPVLLQILSGAHAAQDLLPSGSVYGLPANKVIELSFPGSGLNQGGPHPFHLHGHTFSVVRSADSTDYNYVNPVRRDTVSTGLEDSNVTIRFTTDNAGPWFLHCHIDWHLQLGLAVVFAEDIGTVAMSTPPSAWDNLCPAWNALQGN